MKIHTMLLFLSIWAVFSSAWRQDINPHELSPYIRNDNGPILGTISGPMRRSLLRQVALATAGQSVFTEVETFRSLQGPNIYAITLRFHTFTTGADASMAALRYEVRG